MRLRRCYGKKELVIDRMYQLGKCIISKAILHPADMGFSKLSPWDQAAFEITEELAGLITRKLMAEWPFLEKLLAFQDL